MKFVQSNETKLKYQMKIQNRKLTKHENSQPLQNQGRLSCV